MMKKFYVLILVGLCAAGSCWACPRIDHLMLVDMDGGQCSRTGMGSEVYFTIESNNTLVFWYGDPFYSQEGEHEGIEYTMPDFYAPADSYETEERLGECSAPWNSRIDQIRALDLTRLHNIGAYAFYGMTQLSSVIIPKEIESIGENAFFGCENLTTLRMMASEPPTIYENSLRLNDEGKQIQTIIVPSEEAGMRYMDDQTWNSGGRTFKVAGSDSEIIMATAAKFLGCKATEYDTCQLTMLVGGREKLNYELYPEGAAPSSVDIIINEQPRDGTIIGIEDGYIKTFGWGYNYVYIVPRGGTIEEPLARMLVYAQYIDDQALDPAPEAGQGQVAYTIDANYKLQFWAREHDNPKPALSEEKYNIPDFEVASSAPWYQFRDKITEVVLNNIDNVGKNAFQDLPNLKYIKVPDNVKLLGEFVFLGCTNLKTIEVERYNPTGEPVITTTTNYRSLITDNSNPDDPVRPSIVLVPNDNAQAVYSNWETGLEWSLCTVLTQQGLLGNEPNAAHFHVSPSDSINALRLTIDDNPSSTEDVSVIPDRESGDPSPLDAYGDVVEDLVVTGKVSYIGKNAFTSLTNLKTIQFNQNDHPLDSIHAEAFPEELRRGVFPRKFAFGDPLGGPIIPPALILGDMSEVDATLRWRRLFSDSTVLFVPDSMFEYNGDIVRSIDLYEAANSYFWLNAFFRINDRTVDTTAADTSMVLKWIPLEKAEGYYLTIHEVGCTTGRCDSTIFIPAEGLLGLLDWVRIREEGLIPQYIAARRAPMDEGGGGLVLTISIEENSGSDHTSDVTVNVAGKKNQDYTFTREVVQMGKIASAYTKGGSFHLPDQATSIGEINTEDPTNDKIVNDKIVNIYDLLGRPLGTSLEALSDGIYIIDNGTKRTTILLRR